ncbi:MAG: RDD family protein [uncultured Thiotrichaceae bacterium]|uniref:RDD family protein n=1 Tax=uncultured Thiotrichaceae bacterium TaxID=298394 RepID=A0A6S6T5X8_9GAMM|nr:MAG: RDD family protein [uncultured Thiotrichaceae bacterium]
MENDLYKTPEAPLLRDDLPTEQLYAGFWRRFLATILDTVFILLITIPLTYLVYGDAFLDSEAFVMGGADVVINYLLPFILVIAFWIYKSATPGKMMMGIKIIDAETGGKPSTGQYIGRYFGYILSTIALLLGYFWVIWDKKKQGWHDKLAKTLVVRT